MEGGVVFLIFIHSLLPQFLLISAATTSRNSITPTQSLSDNQTLVSTGQAFELGFFSPSNSKNRYLGIWFKKIPIQTVVWVANRENPLTNSSGVLKINRNGNLVLVNQSEHVIWSSSINDSRVENPIAQLLDSGNLVVKSELSKDDEPNTYIWQSFDYPCDNLIEGMKLGWNLKTGFNRKLTSWKSFEDPSQGDFAYGMDPRGSPELVLRNGSEELFRTGPWNGVQFSGTPELKNNSVFEPIFVNNEDELYYTFKSTGVPVISRFSLNPLGSLQRFTWNERNNEWVVILTAQIDKCNTYGLCGAYGICNIDDTFVCKCLKGFVPKSPEDWDRIDWSSGCRRKTPWDCQNGNGFVKFDSVKLPDTTYSWVNRSILSLKECEMKCLENCSCNAYANLDIRGGGSGCVLWFGDLIDIREFTEGGGQDLYVRMAASELAEVYGGAKKKKKWAIMISISVILGTLVLCSIVWLTICKTRRRRRLGEGNLKEKNYATESQSELDLPLFDFVTVATATGNFSFDNKLGQGGFGPVYKGELPTGQEIAVKRLSKNSDQGLNEFKNEVICIAKLQHRNLVRLLGCCIQREEMMLIYEYMPNKSLDYFIFDEARRKLLGWQKRFDIIIGVAQGLLYLHRDSRLRIIHRDLKASNVLLDSEMNAKISDFGLARTFGGDQTQANTRRVVGTYGYLSPEYAVHGLFSMKSDVFSFGVVVLEIVSGKRNRGFYHPDHDLNLLGHAWKLWNEGKPLELADRELEDPLNRFEVLKCIQVGLLCVQHRPDDRPSMSSVILMLSSDATLPQPNQPGFYHERCLTEEGPSSSEKFFYENKVSVTLLEGR